MKSQIGLIRHGITEGNVRRLYYGRTDVPLAPKGIEELQRLTDENVYPDSENAKLFTTGMTRTIQTKDLIYGERPYEEIEYLQEIDFGEFEMKNYEELLENEDYRDWITAEDLEKAPPGGESINEFNARVIKGYEELRRKHSEHVEKLKNADVYEDDTPLSVVICHGGTISAIMSHIWPDVYDNMYGWIPDPGHGYLLTLEGEEIISWEKF